MTKTQKATISLNDIISADTKHVKYHVNIERLEKNLSSHHGDQNFHKIAKRLITQHKEKRIDSKQYKFSPEVFEVLKLHWQKKKN